MKQRRGRARVASMCNTVYGAVYGAGLCGDGEGVHRSVVLAELCGMVGGGFVSRPVARTAPGPDTIIHVLDR